jgi:hypothetical protein
LSLENRGSVPSEVRAKARPAEPDGQVVQDKVTAPPA